MMGESPTRWTGGTVRWAALAAVALPLLSSCRPPDPAEELPADSTLTTFELGRVGGRIYNEPERTLEILEEVGLTPARFEEKVRSVTDDPEASAEYTRGFQQVARPRERPATGGQPLDSVSGAVSGGSPPGPR